MTVRWASTVPHFITVFEHIERDLRGQSSFALSTMSAKWPANFCSDWMGGMTRCSGSMKWKRQDRHDSDTRRTRKVRLQVMWFSCDQTLKCQDNLVVAQGFLALNSHCRFAKACRTTMEDVAEAERKKCRGRLRARPTQGLISETCNAKITRRIGRQREECKPKQETREEPLVKQVM